MKKILITLLILGLAQSTTFASTDNYDALYTQTEMFPTKLMHNLDPFQDEDYHKYTWSPYPLFRTSSYLYFKDLSIPPGYYLLTPRNLKGKDYVFFKTNGKVQFVVPVAKKTTTPLDFYAKNLPVPKLTKFQKFCKKTKETVFKHLKQSKRVPPPQSFVDIADEGSYFAIKLYFAQDCYIMLFRKVRY